MNSPAIEWLSTVGTFAVTLAVCAFVLVNGIALLVFIRTRDRDLVNRWTGRILAANLAILGAGVGVPVATAVAKVAMTTFSSNVQPRLEMKSEAALEAVPANGAGANRR